MTTKTAAHAPPSSSGPGRPIPSGATWDGEGVNFALYSRHAEKVELCLFDDSGQARDRSASRCASAPTSSGTATCRGAAPGPALRLPRARPLRSPSRATASTRTSCCSTPTPRRSRARSRWSDAQFGYTIGHKKEDLSFDKRDSAAGMPQVRGDRRRLQLGRRPPPAAAPATRASSTRCTSAATPSCIPTCRRSCSGTLRRPVHPPVIDHLKSLGVTTVELLPVHAFVDDRPLVARGLRNYWGYNTSASSRPRRAIGVRRPGRASSRRW